MKKVLGVCILALLIYACNKSNDNDTTGAGQEKPGHIPGMGKTPGEPTGEQFKLPAGVTLKGDIVGNEDGVTGKDCVYDGQGMWVQVKMQLHRDSSTNLPVEVVFPPGLVIVSTSEGFQNGLLVERVVVTIPPAPQGGGGNDCQVTLMLFCLNHDLTPSDRVAKYKLGPVTNSSLIRDLIQKLQGKKINYSAFPPQSDEWSLNSEFIQDAVWSITEGEGLTQEDLRHIRELPDK